MPEAKTSSEGSRRMPFLRSGSAPFAGVFIRHSHSTRVQGAWGGLALESVPPSGLVLKGRQTPIWRVPF